VAFASRSSFVVALKGFSRTEQIALTSMLALSERRALRYMQATPGAIADMLIVDADNSRSVSELRFMPFGTVAMLIGATDHGLLYPTLARPYEWTELLQQLDMLVREQQIEEATPNPGSPPTIPLADILHPPTVTASGRVRSWSAGSVSPPTVWPGFLPEGTVLDTVPSPGFGHAPAATEPDRALLVAVSNTVTEFVRSQLLPMGIVSDVMPDPSAVQTVLSQRLYAWVVIDLDNDKSGALNACKAVKALSMAPRVLLLARNPGLVDKMRMRMAGADAVLDKPLSAASLQDAIQTLRNENETVK
jgi:CheY-like chemotaxis protein